VIVMHECGGSVMFTEAGADLSGPEASARP
jgi:hypothetical protein